MGDEIDTADFVNILQNYNFEENEIQNLQHALENWETIECLDLMSITSLLHSYNKPSNIIFNMLCLMKIEYIKYKIDLDDWTVNVVKDNMFDNKDLQYYHSLQHRYKDNYINIIIKQSLKED